jgi:hypothetical protein
MRPPVALDAPLSAQGFPMGPKREPSSFWICRRDAVVRFGCPGFLRKVFGLVSVQLLATAAVCAFFMRAAPPEHARHAHTPPNCAFYNLNPVSGTAPRCARP